MDFTKEQIQAFRFWIQGYPNFYEPIVEEYFRVTGYRALRRLALSARLAMAPAGPFVQIWPQVLVAVKKCIHDPLDVGLADRAGSIKVSVEATHPEGFDPAWLRNAVKEPLDEADVAWE